MQQFDPITVQRMLELLPEIEKRKRKAKKSRDEQEKFASMMGKPGTGNYVPTQHGGMYQTVAQYRPDYSQVGNNVVGAVGSFLSGRRADREEQELGDMTNEQSIRALEQISRDRGADGAISDNGGATEAALRGYLGMLGNSTDVDASFGKRPHVSGRITDKDGVVWTQMSNGDWKKEDIVADYDSQIIQVPGQEPTLIGKRGAGRGQAQGVTFGAPGASPAPGGGGAGPVPGTPDGIPNVAFSDLTPEQNAKLQQMLVGVEDENAQSMIIDMFMNANKGINAQPQGGPPAAPPPSLRMPTKAEEAADAERARLGVQLEMSGQTNQMEASRAAAVENAKLDVGRLAEIRTNLPRIRSEFENANKAAQQLVNHPGLAQITGKLGGRIPDSPTAVKYFKAVMSGTPAADAMALHEQIKGKVFLQAFQTLKGGGQITNVEGDKATAAMARMDRAQTTEAYVAAVNEFMQAIQAGYAKMEAAAQNGGIAPSPAPVASPPSGDPRAALRAKYGL